MKDSCFCLQLLFRGGSACKGEEDGSVNLRLPHLLPSLHRNDSRKCTGCLSARSERTGKEQQSGLARVEALELRARCLSHRQRRGRGAGPGINWVPGPLSHLAHPSVGHFEHSHGRTGLSSGETEPDRFQSREVQA